MVVNGGVKIGHVGFIAVRALILLEVNSVVRVMSALSLLMLSLLLGVRKVVFGAGNAAKTFIPGIARANG